MAKKKRTDLSENEGFQSSFGSLLQGKGIVLNHPSQQKQSKEPENKKNKESKSKQSNKPTTEKKTGTTPDFSTCATILIRFEKKGRKGKTVTVIAGLGFDYDGLSFTAKAMQKSLGCGGGVEADRVVLHGEHLLRAQAWLKKQGVKKIVLGQRPPK